MRLLLKLNPIKDVPYDLNYHYGVQGLIYGMIQRSMYHKIHDKLGYKFFCYSNIFPVENILYKSRTYNFLFSSPDLDFTNYIYQKFVDSKKIKMSNMEFSIKSIEIKEIEIPEEPFTIMTGTPIIIRVKKESLKDTGNLKKDYEYFYWRNTFPIEIFIKQITINLMKKYIEYNDISSSEKSNNELYSKFLSFFQKFKYKKQVSNVVYLKGISHVVIGSIWEFGFEGWEDKDAIKFAIDCGLGERNSLGFGFLNLFNRPFYI